MPRRLIFSRLIQKNSIDFVIKKEVDGELVNGRYSGPTINYYLIKGILNPLNDDEVNLYDGGKYSTQDIKIITKENIKATKFEETAEDEYSLTEIKDEIKIEEGNMIFHNNSKFKIDREKNRTNYIDYYKFIAVKQNVSGKEVPIFNV